LSTNYYTELAKINVNEHVEKKGKFSYLSWAWAVDTLKKAHPDATWDVIRQDGMPYIKTELGYFVEVAVTVEGITHSQIHPVLDNNNRPIASPNSFQINTSIQRALVKAIALHGLGLYIYAGEDLPDVEGEDDVAEALATPKARGASATTSVPSARDKAIAEAKAKAQAKAAESNPNPAAEVAQDEGVEPINKGQINAIGNMLNLISRKKGGTTADILAPSLAKFGKADLNDLTFEEAKQVVVDLNQAMKQ
jgi:hypothetical protein